MSARAARRVHAEPRLRARALTAGVVILALLAWWPIAPYWQSDDFLAVTYAHELRRACSDLWGAQYAAPALAIFYRPLITLSFALDGWLAGADPWWSHASNVLAHATSVLLLALLGRRTLGDREGIGLAALWALWPAHAGSILWAVGRVDSHTTVWILLSAWATVRWLQDGRGRALSLAAFALALLSKELAFVVPGLVAWLGFALAPAGARLRTAWRTTRPFVWLFAAYLIWRHAVLGQVVGGYQGARFDWIASPWGLLTWSARLAAPGLADRSYGPWLALAFWGFAALAAVRRGRGSAVLCALGCFALCSVPTAVFWHDTAEVKNLRYFYLPAAGLLALAPLAGRLPTLVLLGAVAWPLWQVRRCYVDAHREAARVHALLRAADTTAPPGRFLVDGLPREDESRRVILFHLFVDRLLLPPFGSGRSVLALRPLIRRPGVETVPLQQFVGLADCIPISVRDLALPPPSSLPPLRVEVEGDLHLDSLAMWDLHLRRARHGLRLVGDRSPFYRLTVLTGGGYVACVLANEAPEAADGAVSMGTLFAQGRYASGGDDAMVVLALEVPATLDVSTAFPLLVEGGDRDAETGQFVPRARAPQMLTLRLDRDYSRWLAGKVEDPRAR